MAGDVEAFGRLVERYQGRLVNFVFHLVGNQDDAEEIAQETFLRAYRAISTFRGHSSLYTWFCSIATRVAIRWIRAGPLSENPPRFDDAQPDHPANQDEGGNDPAASAARHETVCQVRRAIQQLPERYRVVLVLVDIDGLEYAEAAEVLRIPINTVRSRLARARELLRRKLRPLLASEG